MPKKPNHNINKALSMTLIFSGAVLILLAFVLMRIENILGWIGSLLSIMRPLFIGIVLTFILYKPTILITEFLERTTKGKRFPCDGAAVAITYVLFLGVLTGLVWIVVPSFISSIEEFSTKFSTYMTNIQNGLDSVLSILQGENGQGILSQMDISAEDIMTQLTSVVSMLPDYVPDVMEKVGEWASGLTGVVTDIIFGIAFSVYILIGRKKLKRQVKRIIRTFFTETTYHRISHYSSLTFRTFSNFVSGQLMEAVILGLLCFLGMTVLGFPYAIMISVIVGVTNIIPIIGPIIGTIPGAVIYLLIDPWRAVWFVVFVVIMQQIDSNLIYPRVVGSSVGLPAIWILFAVTVGGGMFGVIGMVVGVPVMSLIYTILREKTAAAAEADPTDGDADKRSPMFPVVGEKTTALLSKLAQSVRSGFGQVMDKVDERVHRKEQNADQQPELTAEEAQEAQDIHEAMEQLEQEEIPAETE